MSKPEIYQLSDEEKKLQARFLLDGSMHTWDAVSKLKFISYINKKANLPFGTIGLIRTEHKGKGNAPPVIKEIPYASRQTTVELGKQNDISCEQLKEVVTETMVRYTYRATDNTTKRFVDAVGACALIAWEKPLPPDQAANKFMHAETKAKRRATLEVCGLAFLDDSEVDDMVDVVKLEINEETGEVSNGATTAPKSSGSAAPTTAGNAEVVPATKASSASVPTAASNTEPAPNAPAAGIPPAAQSVEAAPSVAASPSSIPIPARYQGNALFAGADDAMVADKDHVDFILTEAQKQCGWTIPVLSQWLKEAFGVEKSNMAQTLTLAMFKRIASGFDITLTNAGR